MSIFNLQASYFTIDNPLRLLERRFNRFRHRAGIYINQRPLELVWTERADSELRRLDRAMVVELQLYFSCVVKKRVLFHRQPAGFDTVRVNDFFGVAFRPIASAACDPNEFSANYPAGSNPLAAQAARMVPRRVEIDFRRGDWEGQFFY